MLTRNQIEAELSLAYLHAVAASQGFAVDVPHIDSDSVDAVIAAKGKVDASSIKHSPKIEIQLKASFNVQVNTDGNISFPLTIKNYDDLRADTMVPRLLVLLALPLKEEEWLVHYADKLVLQKCSYFVNLKGKPASVNAGHQTVYLSSSNILTPAALKNLMIKASKMEDL